MKRALLPAIIICLCSSYVISSPVLIYAIYAIFPYRLSNKQFASASRSARIYL